MIDYFAMSSTVAAIIATIVAAGAIAFDLWTIRRKTGRRRFALPIARAEFSDEVISREFSSEFNDFMYQHIHDDPNLLRRLETDLEKIAVLAIMNDAIIERTAANVHERLVSAGRAERERFLKFVFEWSQTQNKFSEIQILPQEVDPLRGLYEFQKKRQILIRRLKEAAG